MSVSAAKIKGVRVLWAEEGDKALKVCPSNKALSICIAGSITPVLKPQQNRQHRERGEGALGDQTLAVA